MINGFNEKKEKVEVLAAAEIVTVTAEITVTGDYNAVQITPSQLEAFGMEDGNPENYMLISVEQKEKTGTNKYWTKRFKVINDVTYPGATTEPFGNQVALRLYAYNGTGSEKTYLVRAKFIKVA